VGPDTPAELEPLAFLLGIWRGSGIGAYPTIEPFEYGEEMAFEHVGDPFLLYSQRSWRLPDASPLHFERGFLRPGTRGRVELTLAHPLGLSEVSEGVLDGPAMELASTSVARTSTGSAVTALVRRYRVSGELLRYELDMQMDQIPMSRHLTAELRRAEN
jgi:nitrobindin-like protein